MPATRRHPSSTNPRVSGRFSAADTTTWYLATVPQLCALTAESLRLHLSTRNLAMTGNKTVMAQRLYANIHSTGSSAAATISPPPTMTTTTTTQSTPLPLAGSDSPHLNTTTAMVATTTTTANNGQVTTTSASNAGLVVPHSSNSQLQPHHLANLLCQAALQLSGNLSHVLPQLQLPTETLMATAQATTSNQPHPPQQEDQLSEASALIPTNPSAGTPIPTISLVTHPSGHHTESNFIPAPCPSSTA